VTSARLRDARIDLSPSDGTTIYSIDSKAFDSLSEGAATSFDEVLLHLPGVSKDSKASGALHVRDEHGNVQYRINGVQLPENISGFGTAIDTRFIEHVDFLTGALPAQYGLHTAGVVEIQTREGKVKPGGQVDLLFGDHRTAQPSAQLFGSAESLTWYLSASGLASSQGIENPQPTRDALHDDTRQARSFGNLSWFIDDDTRAAVMFAGYQGRFQIPNNPGQPVRFSLAGISNADNGSSTLPSSQLDERQHENNRLLVASFQQTRGLLDYQLSAFHQYSSLHFLPDPAGDLIFGGVAADSLRSSSASGLQFDSAWKLSAVHTLRFGGQYTRQQTSSNNDVSVFPVDAAGAQSAAVPIRIVDDSSKSGQLVSTYLQDEWHPAEAVTLNYGLRYDQVAAFIEEDAWSPRLNAAWKLSEATLLHAGFSRYFTPPPQELAAQRSLALYAGTSNAALSPRADPVHAERSSYYDVGLAERLTPRLTLAVDAYFKDVANLLDEGQFGQALILSPYNYAQGTARGIELSATYGDKRWSSYANLAWQRAEARSIVSGQALFAAAELAYIAGHDIHLDHDQTWTGSLGGSVALGQSQLSADAVFGSGLRRSDAGGTPNGDHLPGYAVLNLGCTHTWKTGADGELEGRLSVVNLFDRVYLLRDGTGVGVGAPQYGLRRGLFVGASLRF
jgi:outer membrane receptor protein involved in Fe transport